MQLHVVCQIPVAVVCITRTLDNIDNVARIDRMYDRTRVDGDSGIQRRGSIVRHSSSRNHDRRTARLTIDFVPCDHLVFLHSVEPVAGVGITAIAALLAVLIADHRQQVSIAVIGKETFDILLVQFPVHILSRVRQPREVVVGEFIPVLRAVAGRVSLVLPLPRGDISRIGVSERHGEQLAAFLGQPASDVVIRLFFNCAQHTPRQSS